MDDLKELLAKATPGPWIFEPHNLAGTEFEGERMPFGFISTDFPSPLFTVDNILAIDPDELDANARIMAMAPDLAAEVLRLRGALKKLDYWFDTDPAILDKMTPAELADHKRQHGIIRAALAKRV